MSVSCCAALVTAAAAAFPAPAAPADPDGMVVLRCEVWAAGGEGGFHLRGYAQGMGRSRESAYAAAARDMRESYGSGQKLGPCVDVPG